MAVLSPHPSIITQNVSELNLHEKIQNSWMSYKVRPILKNQKQIKGQTTNCIHRKFFKNIISSINAKVYIEH